MPYSVKGFFEIDEDMVQILLVLEIFSHRILRLKICSVVLLPALNPACSSAIISSAWGLSLFKITFRITELQLKCVIQRLYDQYFQKFYPDIRTSTKLSTYNSRKNEFVVEKYITCVTNDKHRLALTRLRCSAHKLAIEEGRFRNTDRAQRKRNICNMGCIENEYHFLLICPFYRDLRISIYPLGKCLFLSLYKMDI